jgi:hypothetical protein
MQTTRKFETGLPLFSGLDLGVIYDAQAQITKGDFHGLTAMVETLAKTGSLKTIRKLSAIWTASEIELKAAEANPELMAQLEERAAERPFNETFQEAMDFHVALLSALGIIPVSSAPAEPTKDKGKGKKPKTSAVSPSGA